MEDASDEHHADQGGRAEGEDKPKAVLLVLDRQAAVVEKMAER